jgi:hypothetical protein
MLKERERESKRIMNEMPCQQVTKNSVTCDSVTYSNPLQMCFRYTCVIIKNRDESLVIPQASLFIAMIRADVYLNGRTGLIPTVTSSYEQIARGDEGTLGNWGIPNVLLHTGDKLVVHASDLSLGRKLCEFCITIRAKKNQRFLDSYRLTGKTGSISIYQESDNEFRLNGISFRWDVIDTRLSNLFRLIWLNDCIKKRETNILDARSVILYQDMEQAAKTKLRSDLLFQKIELRKWRAEYNRLYVEVHQQPPAVDTTGFIEDSDEPWTELEWRQAQAQYQADDFCREANRCGWSF